MMNKLIKDVRDRAIISNVYSIEEDDSSNRLHHEDDILYLSIEIEEHRIIDSDNDMMTRSIYYNDKDHDDQNENIEFEKNTKTFMKKEIDIQKKFINLEKFSIMIEINEQTAYFILKILVTYLQIKEIELQTRCNKLKKENERIQAINQELMIEKIDLNQMMTKLIIRYLFSFITADDDENDQ